MEHFMDASNMVMMRSFNIWRYDQGKLIMKQQIRIIFPIKNKNLRN